MLIWYPLFVLYFALQNVHHQPLGEQSNSWTLNQVQFPSWLLTSLNWMIAIGDLSKYFKCWDLAMYICFLVSYPCFSRIIFWSYHNIIHIINKHQEIYHFNGQKRIEDLSDCIAKKNAQVAVLMEETSKFMTEKDDLKQRISLVWWLLYIFHLWFWIEIYCDFDENDLLLLCHCKVRFSLWPSVLLLTVMSRVQPGNHFDILILYYLHNSIWSNRMFHILTKSLIN